MTSRRNILAACLVAPVAIIAPAVAASGSDADIIAAWDQHNVARQRFDNLPASDKPRVEYTPEESAMLKIMDDTEAVIQSTIATTPRGAEIKLWLALTHQLDSDEECEAAARCDLEWFNRNDKKLDWIDRLIVSAIRSLRAQA